MLTSTIFTSLMKCSRLTKIEGTYHLHRLQSLYE